MNLHAINVDTIELIQSALKDHPHNVAKRMDSIFTARFKRGRVGIRSIKNTIDKLLIKLKIIRII
jgi:hypothetical protein